MWQHSSVRSVSVDFPYSKGLQIPKQQFSILSFFKQGKKVFGVKYELGSISSKCRVEISGDQRIAISSN